MLSIMECFDSLQGEGLFQGLPVTFLRVGGCNRRCVLCDTQRSWHKDEKSKLFSTASEIEAFADSVLLDSVVHRARSNLYRLPVVITGGEPAFADPVLMTSLVTYLKGKRPIHVETNGTIDAPWFQNVQVISVSPKLSEGWGNKYAYEDFKSSALILARYSTAYLKLVVNLTSQRDLAMCTSFLDELSRLRITPDVVIQHLTTATPPTPEEYAKEVSQDFHKVSVWVENLGYTYAGRIRFSVQMHKIFGVA